MILDVIIFLLLGITLLMLIVGVGISAYKDIKG